MKIPLSNRLLACCGYVKPGDRVADVGCDHGYLGIYLLKNGIASAVIASDVREMPLQSAIRNAEKFGVKERMSFYLSDGIRDLPREFDCMVCAGMGADTMISILDAAPWLKSERYRLILQCQSKRPELRRYLYGQGYAETLTEGEYYITPALRRSGSELLPAFRESVLSGLRKTVAGLSGGDEEKYRHYKAILEELTDDDCS
ncbi:MAG: hypothetical protein BHW31_04450 [Firmicutes bacterium CAG:110_56_8]|nr:MAG: hypothetical protein BHW31_04450 [Firmicutes bacterium CAG:110_56_8]